MSKSESQIQSEILLAASKRGHRLFRSNAGQVRTQHGGVVKLFPAGFPDVLGWNKDTGQFVVIEVKRPQGRLSKHQVKFAEFAQSQPIIYGVARSASQAIDIIENGAKYYK